MSVQSKKVVIANMEMMNNMSLLSSIRGKIFSGNGKQSVGLELKEQLKILSDKVKMTQV